MALLVPQQTNDQGAAITYAAASDTGDSVVADPDLVVHIKNSSGANESQTITITGTPTGGTFTLQLVGEGNGYAVNETTAAIAYNANAAAVQAALEALIKVIPGDVVVTGGPLPGTPIVVTFTGFWWGWRDVVPMVATPSFTGGTTPAIAVTETSKGRGAITVVFEAFNPCNQGYLHNTEVFLPTGADVFVGPFDSYLVATPSGQVSWDYSAVTGVQVAALLV